MQLSDVMMAVIKNMVEESMNPQPGADPTTLDAHVDLMTDAIVQRLANGVTAAEIAGAEHVIDFIAQQLGIT